MDMTTGESVYKPKKNEDLLVAEERTPLAALVDSGINPEVDADEATVEIAVDTPAGV